MLDKCGSVGISACQCEKNYKSKGFFVGMFLAPKSFSLTIYKVGIVLERTNFKGFIDRKRLLDRSQKFKLIGGERVWAVLP